MRVPVGEVVASPDSSVLARFWLSALRSRNHRLASGERAQELEPVAIKGQVSLPGVHLQTTARAHLPQVPSHLERHEGIRAVPEVYRGCCHINWVPTGKRERDLTNRGPFSECGVRRLAAMLRTSRLE